MGHTAETRARAYQKIKDRKAKWFFENGPCIICDSWENLELDHINPKLKISHNIWSWSEEKRQQELKKCQILCEKCHLEKTKLYFRELHLGKPIHKMRIMTDYQLAEAKLIRACFGYTMKELSKIYNVSHNGLSHNLKYFKLNKEINIRN